jgi:hypothetical protein
LVHPLAGAFPAYRSRYREQTVLPSRETGGEFNEKNNRRDGMKLKVLDAEGGLFIASPMTKRYISNSSSALVQGVAHALVIVSTACRTVGCRGVETVPDARL